MASNEIGNATFGLVVGLGKFARDLDRAERMATDSGTEIGDELASGTQDGIDDGAEGIGSRFQAALGPLVSVAAGIGVAAGAVFVSSLLDAMEQERDTDRVAASLGLSPADAERLGDIAGRVYAGAWGDSFSEVAEAVGVVQSTFDKLDESSIERLTQRALDFVAVFGGDLPMVVSNAGILLETGLARDAEHAFDLMVRGMQLVPVGVRDELGEAIHEYSQYFAGLGLSGEEAFGMLVDGARGGRYMIDKIGDSIKEFRIRATDMSAATVAAYDTLGLSAEDMTRRLLQGGETANAAYNEILAGILAIEDPALRANTAITLFGTPLEDISGDAAKLDETLAALAGGGMTDVEGAAARMGDTLNDNAATRVEEFKRTLQQGFVNFLADEVIPRAEELQAIFEKEGLGGVIDRLAEWWEQGWPRIQELLNKGKEALVGWLQEAGPPALKALGSWLIETGVPELIKLGVKIKDALIEGAMDLGSDLIEKAVDAAADLQDWVGREGKDLLIDVGRAMASAVTRGFRDNVSSGVLGALGAVIPGAALVPGLVGGGSGGSGGSDWAPTQVPRTTNATKGRFTVPGFHTGGLVTPSMAQGWAGMANDEVLAMLRVGEVVSDGDDNSLTNSSINFGDIIVHGGTHKAGRDMRWELEQAMLGVGR